FGRSLEKCSELYDNFFKPSKLLEERAAKGIPLSAPTFTSSPSRAHIKAHSKHNEITSFVSYI
ncbi:hypothetical protein H5410_059482, partial [Solanum commersonii]